MKSMKSLSLVFVFALFSEEAYADFPLPPKTVPFTENGISYVHEIEFLSHTGAYYTLFCQSSYSNLLFSLENFDGYYKLIPYGVNAGCQLYKFSDGSWSMNWDTYWYQYVHPAYCLNDSVRTSTDVYLQNWMPTVRYNGQYCINGTVSAGQLILVWNWDFVNNTARQQ